MQFGTLFDSSRNIVKGFVNRPVESSYHKTKVRAHVARTKTGKVAQVKEHQRVVVGKTTSGKDIHPQTHQQDEGFSTRDHLEAHLAHREAGNQEQSDHHKKKFEAQRKSEYVKHYAQARRHKKAGRTEESEKHMKAAQDVMKEYSKYRGEFLEKVSPMERKEKLTEEKSKENGPISKPTVKEIEEKIKATNPMIFPEAREGSAKAIINILETGTDPKYALHYKYNRTIKKVFEDITGLKIPKKRQEIIDMIKDKPWEGVSGIEKRKLSKIGSEKYTETEAKEKLGKYAKEIIQKLGKKYNIKEALPSQVVNTVNIIFAAMGSGESNPNYKKRKEFFPEKFDPIIINNGEGNMYDSPYYKLTDKQQETIIKKALKEN